MNGARTQDSLYPSLNHDSNHKDLGSGLSNGTAPQNQVAMDHGLYSDSSHLSFSEVKKLEASLKQLSIQDLRTILARHNVDCSGCIEKVGQRSDLPNKFYLQGLNLILNRMTMCTK